MTTPQKKTAAAKKSAAPAKKSPAPRAPRKAAAPAVAVPVVVEPEPLDTVHPKVAAATAGGAGVSLLVWLGSSLGFDMPVEIAGALVTIGAFIAGYLKRSAA